MPSSCTSQRPSTSTRSKRTRRARYWSLVASLAFRRICISLTRITCRVSHRLTSLSKEKISMAQEHKAPQQIHRRPNKKNKDFRNTGSMSSEKCSTNWCSWSRSQTAFSTNTCRQMQLTTLTRRILSVKCPKQLRWRMMKDTGRWWHLWICA